MTVEAHIPLADELLAAWKTEIGNDYLGYKNHVYRLLHFCFALHTCNPEEREKLIIAGCFHDLGIWANGTFDYLAPSIALAKAYVEKIHREQWMPEIERMIDMHHRIRTYQDERYPLVEVFRKADWIDVSFGILAYGLPRTYIQRVKAQFPDAGFHKRLVQLTGERFARHPFSPIPVLKW